MYKGNKGLQSIMKSISLLLTLLVFSCSQTFAQSGVKKALKTGEQSELKRIMIDAGHGGKDSGCRGKISFEKDVALQIALKLGNQIKSNYPDIEIIYTRKDDTFIPLFERINMANDKSVDLFMSIHCNYAQNKNVKGTETFVMGLHRAEENLNVAKRENEVILMENDHEITYDGFDPSSTEGHIILSMYQNLYLDQSIDFASKVESSISSNLKVSRGVKQAGFVVLRRATMPAVLIETGFLSNSEEEKYLNSESGQQELVDGITKALSKYMGDMNPTTIIKEDIAEAKPIEKVKAKTEVPATTKKTKTEPSSSSKEIYRLQIAALKSKTDEYDSIPNKLGFPVTVVESNGWIKYQVGNFLSKEDANKAKTRLAELGIAGGFVVSVSK
jgi:N-acetylmuramoyl-L-alanine amidase